jgi:hypothetical protein
MIFPYKVSCSLYYEHYVLIIVLSLYLSVCLLIFLYTYLAYLFLINNLI